MVSREKILTRYRLEEPMDVDYLFDARISINVLVEPKL
jgi:hypothetical protein